LRAPIQKLFQTQPTRIVSRRKVARLCKLRTEVFTVIGSLLNTASVDAEDNTEVVAP